MHPSPPEPDRRAVGTLVAGPRYANPASRRGQRLHAVCRLVGITRMSAY